MPGFAKPPVSTIGADQDPFTLDSVSDQTFYGFRYNYATAKLNVEVISDGSVVSLPEPNIISDTDYQQWVWTKSNLAFSWNNANKSHMLVEVR